MTKTSKYVYGCIVAVILLIAAINIPCLMRSRMAANESSAIEACKKYATAQDSYSAQLKDSKKPLEYAQSLRELADLKLIPADLAAAEGVNGKPYHGYLFKVLTAQGPEAPGGAKSYVVDGHMTLGYALMAVPAAWDATARNTFMISGSGTLYQRDTGENKFFDAFNVNSNWIQACD